MRSSILWTTIRLALNYSPGDSGAVLLGDYQQLSQQFPRDREDICTSVKIARQFSVFQCHSFQIMTKVIANPIITIARRTVTCCTRTAILAPT